MAFGVLYDYIEGILLNDKIHELNALDLGLVQLGEDVSLSQNFLLEVMVGSSGYHFHLVRLSCQTMLREEILDIHTSLRCVDHRGLFVLVNTRFFEALKRMDMLETFLKILPAIKEYLSGPLCIEIDTMEPALTTVIFLGLSIDTARMQLHDFIDYHV